jgi:hypothetical protein
MIYIFNLNDLQAKPIRVDAATTTAGVLEIAWRETSDGHMYLAASNSLGPLYIFDKNMLDQPLVINDVHGLNQPTWVSGTNATDLAISVAGEDGKLHFTDLFLPSRRK